MKITKQKLIEEVAVLKERLSESKEPLNILAELLNIKQTDVPFSPHRIFNRRFNERDIEWPDIYFEIGILKASLYERTNQRDIRNWQRRDR